VRALGPAVLPGYELRWHKRSVDGSGKCSIVPSSSAAAVVHGALFTIPKEEKHLLDRVEGGYGDIPVGAQSSQGVVSAQTYVAGPTHVDDSLRPYAWYRDLVVSGAESQNLPAEYLESLRLVVVWQDQDAERASRNRVSLPCGGSE
jgi:gamma-glutamylcyclotransferase